jgi:uncharacterized protein
MKAFHCLAAMAAVSFLWVPLAAHAQSSLESAPAPASESLSRDEEQVAQSQVELTRQLRTIVRTAAAGLELDAAIEGLTTLAKGGDVDAAFALGEYYRLGRVEPPNLEQAALFYGIASESNTSALIRLGDIHLDGADSGFDAAQSIVFYTQAAERGNLTALNRLGDIYARGDFVERDPLRAIEYYTKAYHAGEVKRARRIADLYRSGEAGLDRTAALPFYEAAAATGDAAAMMFAGDYYRDGVGVPADPMKAEAYYRQAIEAGRSQALARLVNGLRAGTVGTGGAEVANAVLEEGVVDGNPTAILLLANALIKGQDMEPNPVRALELLERAGADVAAQLRLIDLLTGEVPTITPNASRATAALERVRENLDTDEVALAELIISAANRPGPADLSGIGAAFAELPQLRQREALQRLFRLDVNAYVVALQGILKENGYYEGPLSGQLTERTIGGLNKLCEARGILEKCRRGPIDPSVMRAIAEVI